jgi:hypothetical protein
MHLAYVDESGSVGANSSLTFTLGCVMVDAARWADVFDDVIGYRRYLRDTFGVPVRAEIKANYLIRNGGPFRQLKLSETARYRIYRGLMRLQAKLQLLSFAVVIRKDALRKDSLDPRDIAWEYLLQRLERFTATEKTHIWLSFDEGEGPRVRAITRKARRAGTAGSAFGAGYLKRPARLIIDDPVARKSHESYFIQLADLTAYAAFRKLYPPPARDVQIVPQGMWDELGIATYTRANYLNSKGVPGIVAWP